MYEYYIGWAHDLGLTADGYLATLKKENGGGLRPWARELRQWCHEEESGQRRRRLVQSIAKHLDAARAAPINNELMARYQVALDGELYRAMEALRKQQQWRRSSGIVVEGDAKGEADVNADAVAI